MFAISLYIPFFISLMMAIINSAILPTISLNAFCPFLPFIYKRYSLQKSLFISCGCGLILDLLSSEFHFGVHALSFVMTTFLLYHQKKHFFEDRALPFSLFSLFISICLTTMQLLILYILNQEILVTQETLLTDYLLLPLIDGAYSFLCFTCPILIYLDLKKIYKKLFLSPPLYRR
ncbi:MAG: hypothetical protein QRY72_02490 [Candidatus Rhabdochlamydia sp.]